MSRFQQVQARLVSTVALSARTRHLEFEVMNLPRLGFVPGQWLSITVDRPGGGTATRAYSIASPPADNGRFALCVNRVDEGTVSNHLCDLAEGDAVACEGPFGNFILRPPQADALLIATGTGIAPFRSMVHWLAQDPARLQGCEVWLLFGSRDEAELYYHDEFRLVAASHPRFHYAPTLSRAGPGWGGLRGRVQEHLGAILPGRADAMRAYVCGRGDMVATTRARLQDLGVSQTSIFTEKYD